MLRLDAVVVGIAVGVALVIAAVAITVIACAVVNESSCHGMNC